MRNNLPFEKIRREVIVKKEAITSNEYGCEPDKRKVEEIIQYGVVNIDKPKGPTSHQVSDFVQRILGIERAGHSGTLDPGVTGVLPVALGKSTRVVECLLKAGKEYVAVMHVHKDVDEKTIKKTMKQFVGKIMQLPPLKSAVKRQLRQKEIYYIEILEIEGKDVLFLVGCEAGTYIRKLIFDIGKKIGGAHMAELRRTKVAAFTEENLVTLQDLADAAWYWKNEKDESRIRKCILPVESAVEHLPKIWVLDTSVDSLCHGAALKIPGIAKLHTEIKKDDEVALFTLKNELIAVGKSLAGSDEIIENNKGIAVKINKVFMSPGVYPTINK